MIAVCRRTKSVFAILTSEGPRKKKRPGHFYQFLITLSSHIASIASHRQQPLHTHYLKCWITTDGLQKVVVCNRPWSTKRRVDRYVYLPNASISRFKQRKVFTDQFINRVLSIASPQPQDSTILCRSPLYKWRSKVVCLLIQLSLSRPTARQERCVAARASVAYNFTLVVAISFEFCREFVDLYYDYTLKQEC